MISVVFAVLAAAANAAASVLQRRAARSVPDRQALRPSLLWTLVRRPVWLGGIVAMTAGFVFQAAALSQGGLALVQPVLVTELPFTMILISLVFGIRLHWRSWMAVAALTIGLTIFLAAASPGPGSRIPDPADWTTAATATLGVVVALVVAARLASGAARAAAFGVSAGIGFAFTATMIKETTALFEKDPGLLPTSWPPYAMVGAGLCSLFLLQNALQSGTLVAAQPALTISDPVASTLYGTMLFGEEVRTGTWILAEVAGMGLIVYGSILLARSFSVRAQAAGAPPPA